MGKNIIGVFSSIMLEDEKAVDTFIMNGTFTVEELQQTNNIIKNRYGNNKMIIGKPELTPLPSNILELIQ